MTQSEFFSATLYRSTLLTELCIEEVVYVDGKSYSYEQLRHMVAVKLFGAEIVESKPFKKVWAENMIAMLTRVSEREQYNGKTKARQKKSQLPLYIRDRHVEILEWKKIVEINS